MRGTGTNLHAGSPPGTFSSVACGCEKPAWYRTTLIRRERQSQTNPRATVRPSQLSPFTSRKFAGESKANGFRASLVCPRRPAISSREEVVSGWRRQPSRLDFAYGCEGMAVKGRRGRAGARLQDGRACRSLVSRQTVLRINGVPPLHASVAMCFRKDRSCGDGKCCGHRP